MVKKTSKHILSVFRFLWLYRQQVLWSFLVAFSCGNIYVVAIRNKKDQIVNSPFPDMTNEERLVFIGQEVKKLNLQCIIVFIAIVLLVWFLFFILLFKRRENCNPFYYWRHYYSRKH